MKTTIEINGCKILKKGVKSPAGKYTPAWYSHGALVNGTVCVTIYAKSCSNGLPKELVAVENNSDMMTDYFEKDRCRFAQGSKEYDLLRPLAI